MSDSDGAASCGYHLPLRTQTLSLSPTPLLIHFSSPSPHFVAGLRSHSMDCSRAHCASRDVLRFSINVRVRSQPHRTSSSTKCSGRARRSGACSGWVASVAQGARGCGWSKHESGPAWHALQLCSIEYVPPKPTSRERELPTYISIVSEMLGRLPR